MPARRTKNDAPSSTAASYVGGKSCAGCHAKEYEAWQKSQHHDAMAQASEQSVLGNFNNAKFAYAGLTSTFFKRDGKFFVNTDGRDGKLADYKIKYTFGVSPLQQYLIAFPDGQLQALSISFFLIADIDSPRGGVIHVQPENLLSLVESLRAH